MNQGSCATNQHHFFKTDIVQPPQAQANPTSATPWCGKIDEVHDTLYATIIF